MLCHVTTMLACNPCIGAAAGHACSCLFSTHRCKLRRTPAVFDPRLYGKGEQEDPAMQTFLGTGGLLRKRRNKRKQETWTGRS